MDESELIAMRASHDALLAEVAKLGEEEATLRTNVLDLKAAIENDKELERKEDQERFERILRKNELTNALALIQAKEEANHRLDAAFLEEIQ